MNPRTRLLREACELVNGPRNEDYGPPSEDFARTARLWSAYLGIPLESWDIAICLGLVKVSRLKQSPTHEDSWKDLAGYSACGWDCVVNSIDSDRG